MMKGFLALLVFMLLFFSPVYAEAAGKYQCATSQKDFFVVDTKTGQVWVLNRVSDTAEMFVWSMTPIRYSAKNDGIISNSYYPQNPSSK